MTQISPLYVMKPNFLNLFMKKLTWDRVVPIISASISCDTLGSCFVRMARSAIARKQQQSARQSLLAGVEELVYEVAAITAASFKSLYRKRAITPSSRTPLLHRASDTTLGLLDSIGRFHLIAFLAAKDFGLYFWSPDHSFPIPLQLTYT